MVGIREPREAASVIAPDTGDFADPQASIAIAEHRRDRARPDEGCAGSVLGELKRSLIVPVDPHRTALSGCQQDARRTSRQLDDVELVGSKAVKTAIRSHPYRTFAILEYCPDEISGQALFSAERLGARLR